MTPRPKVVRKPQEETKANEEKAEETSGEANK
jgi:hypothetical protein